MDMDVCRPILAWLTACATLIATANLIVFTWLFWKDRTWAHVGLVAASFSFVVAGGIQSRLLQETLAGRYVNTATWYLGIGIATLFAQVLLAIAAIKMSYQHRE